MSDCTTSEYMLAYYRNLFSSFTDPIKAVNEEIEFMKRATHKLNTDEKRLKILEELREEMLDERS